MTPRGLKGQQEEANKAMCPPFSRGGYHGPAKAGAATTASFTSLLVFSKKLAYRAKEYFSPDANMPKNMYRLVRAN